MSLKRMNKLIGTGPGLYLSLFKCLKMNPPVPVKVPIFGLVKTYHEINNIRDNFESERLRDSKAEQFLSKQSSPLIIDCGINVGITVRWWFHINPAAKVFGVDMVPETHAFTIESLRSIGINKDRYKPFTAAIWEANGKEFKIGITDPLFGDTGLYRPDKEETERIVVSKTLDTIFEEENIGEVALLKLDIEGAGGDALKGADKLIKKVRHVVIEIHSEEECRLSSNILAANNFGLRGVTSKHLWWERSGK